MKTRFALALVTVTFVAARPAAATDGAASYRVTTTPALTTLVVDATFPGGVGRRFEVDPGMDAFVSGVELVEPPGAGVVTKTGRAWELPACERATCRVRYRFALGRAADARADVDEAGRQGAAIVAPPSTWLLRPAPPSSPLRYELRVEGLADGGFQVGLTLRAPGVYAGTIDARFAAPYAAFGAFRRVPLSTGAAGPMFAVASPALERDLPRVRDWVERAARAVTAYYGRFPVPGALVVAVEKAEGVHGKEMGGGQGASVLLELAPGADLSARSIEWMATHELVHLAVPNMDRRHTWLTEGLATYIEPIARAQRGDVPASRVWRDALSGMPNGLPEEGDRGLDHTATWGRTYWGGALFFLMADVEIARQTGGRQSLQSALRGALAAGADTTVAWTPERFFAAGDAAVGRSILVPMYRRWANTPVAVDLDALWRDLGVVVAAGSREPTFDDHARWAWIRQALTRTR